MRLWLLLLVLAGCRLWLPAFAFTAPPAQCDDRQLPRDGGRFYCERQADGGTAWRPTL